MLIYLVGFLYLFEVYSIDSSKMMGNFLEFFLNFNQLSSISTVHPQLAVSSLPSLKGRPHTFGFKQTKKKNVGFEMEFGKPS